MDAIAQAENVKTKFRGRYERDPRGAVETVTTAEELSA